jgi:hypothetical protein
MKCSYEGSALSRTIWYYGSLLFLYAINHGWVLLLAPAVFWDDWVLFGAPDSAILELFQQWGSTSWYPVGEIHVLLLQAGVWLYRVLTFLFMFGAGVALDRVLRQQGWMPDRLRFLTVLLFLILPLYWARVALINIHYSACYFLFFAAWALMDRHRILSLALFFLSFTTNSLLVFFALPFADRVFRRSKGDRNLRSMSRIALANTDYVLLPLVFFGLKFWLFRPFGMYAGYNESFSLINLLASPLHQWNDCLDTVVQFAHGLRLSASTTLTVPVAGAGACLALAAVTLRSRLIAPFIARPPSEPSAWRLWGLVGLAALLLAVFPYWILGKVPTFGDWGSRHQLLMALGLSLILTTFISRCGRRFTACICVLVCVCTYLNAHTYLSLKIDWQKQKELVQLLRDEPAIEQADLVIFDDECHAFNALRRKYRFYEWSGLLAMAFGNEKRLGVSHKQLDEFLADRMQLLSSHKQFHRCSELDLSHSLSTARVVISEDRPANLRARLIQLGIPRFRLDVEPLSRTSLGGRQDP